nr:hypothetical protein [Tanacetum cinerariifolium]
MRMPEELFNDKSEENDDELKYSSDEAGDYRMEIRKAKKQTTLIPYLSSPRALDDIYRHLDENLAPTMEDFGLPTDARTYGLNF